MADVVNVLKLQLYYLLLKLCNLLMILFIERCTIFSCHVDKTNVFHLINKLAFSNYIYPWNY